ncbi:YadA-like family protein [Salmonella enterica]|uniref:YadA-like family protein n=2 Tax=Salmonella enterica TaxID=28901 RepID=UPI001C461074|nr:YadA-like family protein [Salmonella enterica]
MKVQHIKLVPTALLIVNTLNIGQAQAEDTLVCSTTGSGIDDFFCGPDSSTSGARRSIAIGDNVLIPKITVPGKTGIEQAIAIGSNVQGGGDNSITLGNDIITAGTGSVAIGGDDAAGIYNAGNKGYLLKTYGAKNNDSNISDFRANAALGNGTVSLGAGAQALADGAISIGAAATAGDGTQNGTGWSSTSGKQSIALGVESSALNHNAIALGYRANVTGYSGTAIGENASATSNNAIALGTNAMARDISDIAIGLNAIAQNSNGVTLASSLAIGSEAKAMTNNSFAIGSEAQALSPGAIAFGPSTTAGNNTGPAAGNNAIAIGFLANAPSQNSLAMGRGATTNGAPQSIALGYAAKTSAAEAIALGTNSAASGLNSIALGKEAKTTATNSIAIGTGSLVSGLNSGAIGVPGTVSGSNAYSVGNNNTIMADNAFVVGNAVNNTVENSVALGNGSTVSGATGTSVYTVNGVTHNFAGAVPVSTVSIGAAGKERTLTNVAAARISAGSTDAVNGSQLFAVTSEVDKGNQFAGNTGTFNRRLGEPTIISGGLATNATASNKNIRTIAKDGTIDIQLADNLDVTSVKVGNSVINNDGLHITDGPSVTSGGIDAGNNIIRNVADGANETDAVNKHQFDTLSGIVGKGWGLQVNSGETEAIVPGETVNFTEGDNIKITRSGKTLNIATARRVDFERATVGDITLDQATGKITGVADGELSADSKDAVSGHQLFATNQNVARNTRDIAANKALLNNGMNFAGNKGAFNRRLGEVTTISGGLATEATASNKNIRTIAKDGTIDIQLADNLDVTSVKVGNSVINNDGLHITDGPSVTSEGINAGNRVISNVGDAVSDTDAVNKRQLDNLSTTVNRGWNLQVNSGDTESIAPGDTLNITEGDNIQISRTGKTLNIATARKVSFDNVTVGNISLDKDTGKIGGLSDGLLSTNSKDAVTGGQLFSTNENVTTNTRNIAANKVLLDSGLNFTGNTGSFNRRLGETTTIRGGLAADAAASNKNIRTEAKDGLLDIQLADNLDVTSVKTGNALLSNDGLHITGGPSVTEGGIDAGNRVISNVGDAVSDTDAVNKRQLDNLSSIVGQGLTFSANEGGDITRRPGDILALRGDATTKGEYNGKNIKTVTDISTGIISIKIAESPVFGNVVINDSNSGKITGVSDGSIVSGSKDVVNGGQIHHVTTAISNIIGGNAHVSTDGSLITSNIGNTGKDTIHDAIDSVRNVAENASAGWNLSVNGQESSTVKPKDTVDLSNADGNISITKKDNQVSFNLSDSVKVKESIGIKNGPALTRSGVDGAGMKITNVADGTIAAGSSDAINGGQIHDFVNGEVTRPITFTADTGTPYDARLGTTLNVKGDKNIQTMVSGNTLSVSLNENINVKSVKATDSLSVASGASIDMGGNAIQNVGNATRPGDAVNYGQFQQAFSSLGDQINRVERRANAGAAAAIATAGLTQAYIPGKSMMSMSGGTFQGESSLAIGLSTISDNGNWVLKGSFSSTTRNQTGASVGVGFQF